MKNTFKVTDLLIALTSRVCGLEHSDSIGISTLTKKPNVVTVLEKFFKALVLFHKQELFSCPPWISPGSLYKNYYGKTINSTELDNLHV